MTVAGVDGEHVRKLEKVLVISPNLPNYDIIQKMFSLIGWVNDPLIQPALMVETPAPQKNSLTLCVRTRSCMSTYDIYSVFCHRTGGFSVSWVRRLDWLIFGCPSVHRERYFYGKQRKTSSYYRKKQPHQTLRPDRYLCRQQIDDVALFYRNNL